jgi:hydrogenase maturation factor
MTVVRVDHQCGLALCADADGGRVSVETALVEPVAPGDRLLVHAGTALVKSAGADSIGTSASELPGGSAHMEVPGVIREMVVES